MRQTWKRPIHAAVLLPVCLLSACTIATLPVAERSPAGSFLGETDDHRPIRVTISEAAQGFVGYGTLDGSPFSLTLLTSYRGAGLLSHDGRFRSLEAELSVDGERLTLDAFGAPTVLYRAGSSETRDEREPEGRLTGCFRSGGSRPWIGEVELTQRGNLVLGSGTVYGQAFVLSGLLAGADAFEGRALFEDGSEAKVEGGLDSADRRLSVAGLAGRIELRRQSCRGGNRR